MYSQVVIPEGTCPSDFQISQMFGNLEFFKECADSIDKQFKCASFTGDSSGALGEETCAVVRDNANLNPVGGSVEQKMIFVDYSSAFNIQYSGDTDQEKTTTFQTFTVQCDGEYVGELQEAKGMLYGCFDCPDNSLIEICSTGTARNPDQAALIGTVDTKFCGITICIGEVNTALDNYFNPGFQEGCCYGRDFVNFYLQNLDNFINLFSQFGQVPGCSQYDFNDSDDHQIITNAQTTTDFFVIGSVETCAVNTSTSSTTYVTVKPNISCGSQNLECIEKRYSIPPSDNNNLIINGLRAAQMSSGTDCFYTPIVACGTCQVGDNLIIGLQGQIECDEDFQQVSNPGTSSVTSTNQNYCLYTFERTQTDFGSPLETGLPKCISWETFERIREVSNQIAELCDELEPIELDIQQDEGQVINDGSFLIQAPQPWPPVNNPTNADPPPIKKRYINATIDYCARISIPSSSNAQPDLRSLIEITCGGTVLELEFEEVQITTGTSLPWCGTVSISKCVECPIDQELEINLSSVLVNNSDGSINSVTYQYNYKTFCF